MKVTEVGKIAAREKPMNQFPLMEASSDHVVLFHLRVPSGAAQAVAEVLSTRWIGDCYLVLPLHTRKGW